MDTFTVSFFGHRQFDHAREVETMLAETVTELLLTKDYVEFLVGRNGAFDWLVASTVRRCKRTVRNDNSALVLVLPYLTAEYKNNVESFHAYYDEVEVCPASSKAHFKAAHQTRNRFMVDRSDLIVFCVQHLSGGAYQTMRYAEKTGKRYTVLSVRSNY